MQSDIKKPLANQLLKYNAVTARWENWIPDYLTFEIDGSVSNELQMLSIDGNQLSITDGNSVALPVYSPTGEFYYLDKDQDGFGNVYCPVWVPESITPPAYHVNNDDDCADDNPLIKNPSVEICDGVDNDCDGLIDEDFPGKGNVCFDNGVPGVLICDPSDPTQLICFTEAFPDQDGDGYTSYTDCNDNDPSIHPGATEICDGRDNDCNGAVDDNALCPNGQCIAGQCVEFDNDGDGYTVSEGDCNDNDAYIYPGATEICGDGIDQDCDGEVDEGCAMPAIFNPNLTYGSVTDVENNTYKTIQIGTQTWMAENLKVTKFNNGDAIPYIDYTGDWSTPITSAFTDYFDTQFRTHLSMYGRLYNYYAVVDNRNLCPIGWHVPLGTDLELLVTTLGGLENAAIKLKESGITHWANSSLQNTATNETGFTALPGGIRVPSPQLINGLFFPGFIAEIGSASGAGGDGWWWYLFDPEHPADHSCNFEMGSNYLELN